MEGACARHLTHELLMCQKSNEGFHLTSHIALFSTCLSPFILQQGCLKLVRRSASSHLKLVGVGGILVAIIQVCCF